jgi:hypothetical protein
MLLLAVPLNGSGCLLQVEMTLEVERLPDSIEPHLDEMTVAALDILEGQRRKGYPSNFSLLLCFLKVWMHYGTIL